MSDSIDFGAILFNLAMSLADEVVRAARKDSFSDVVAAAEASPARTPARQAPEARKPVRASSPPLARKAADARLERRLVGLLSVMSDGMRAEQLRDALNVDKAALERALRDGLESGRLRKAGQKRLTTYFAV